MSWLVQIENSQPPLYVEFASGLHGYTNLAGAALKLVRRDDALDIAELFIEGESVVDDGVNRDEVWAVCKDATNPAEYYTINSGFIETTTNTSAALQFASQNDANAFAALIVNGHTVVQLV